MIASDRSDEHGPTYAFAASASSDKRAIWRDKCETAHETFRHRHWIFFLQGARWESYEPAGSLNHLAPSMKPPTRHLATSAAAVLTLLTASTVRAAAGKLESADATLLKDIAQANIAEVESGKLAIEKSSNAEKIAPCFF
jgi:hypothetical protein